MNVSSIRSSSNPHSPVAQSQFKQQNRDFRALGKALKSGDLASAQQAFSSLQSDFQTSSQTGGTTSTNTAFGQNSQIGQDFQALQTALQSGDLSSAQSAFSSIQQSLHGAGAAHHMHHGRHASGATSTQANQSQDSDGDGDADGTGTTGVAGTDLDVQA